MEYSYHLFLLSIWTNHCCWNYLTCFSSFSTYNSGLNILHGIKKIAIVRSDKKEMFLIFKKEHAVYTKVWRNLITKITWLLELSDLFSLIFNWRISLGSSSEADFRGLTASFEAESICCSTDVEDFSVERGSPETLWSASCSSFTLLRLESPPYKAVERHRYA